MNPRSLLHLQVTPIPPLQELILLPNLSLSLALNSSSVTVMLAPPEGPQPQLCLQGTMPCSIRLQLSTQTCHKAKNCQYRFSAVLSGWGSWNSLKISGIHVTIETSSKHFFCYQCFHRAFRSNWDFFFLSESSFPYYWSRSLVWHHFHHAAHHLFTNKTAATIVGTSRIWVFLQQNLSTKRKT